MLSSVRVDFGAVDLSTPMFASPLKQNKCARISRSSTSVCGQLLYDVIENIIVESNYELLYYNLTVYFGENQ